MSSGGIVDVGGERITNVGEPTRPDHAATKGYVDDSGGGSQPVLIQDFAFDTPGIVAGITLLTPAAGSVIGVGLSIPTTPFDGSGPFINVYFDGDDPDVDAIAQTDATQTNTPFKSTGASIALNGMWPAGGQMLICGGAAVKLNLDDNNGGDPGSTVGEGTVYVYHYSP